MAMVTNKAGRLLGYSWRELGQHTWREINSLPYGIGRAMAAAQAAADARETTLGAAQDAAGKIEAVAYSALEQAVQKMSAAADSLLQSLT